MIEFSDRQQKYKANRLAGMNKYNAARSAGYSHNYASKRAIMLDKVVNMKDAFEQAGLTDKAIVAHALAGLNAIKLQSCDILVSRKESKDADELVINKNSNDFVEVEDWTARHKYFDTILKITGKLQEKIGNSLEIKGQAIQIFQFNGNGKANTEDKSAESRVSRFDSTLAT